MGKSKTQDVVVVIAAFLVAILTFFGMAYVSNDTIRGQMDAVLGITGPSIADVTPSESETAAEAEDSTAVAERSAEPATTPAEEAAQDGPAVPELDVVRVEPSGDAVFAGRVEPGWDVELRANGETIGSAEANEQGEWAIVTEEPLDAGSSDITLHARSPDGAMTVNAPDRVAVDISETRKSQPLVVVSGPDVPSDVVQIPETASAEAPAAEVAEAVEQAVEEKVAGAAAPPSDGADGEGATEETVVAAVAPTADQDTAQPDGQASDGATVSAPSASADEAAMAPTADDTTQTLDDTAVATAPATDAGASDGTESPQASATEEETASQEQAVAAAPAQDATSTEPTEAESRVADAWPDAEIPKAADETLAEAAIEPKVDEDPAANVAIETVEKTETERLFITGRAEPGESVRAYSDNVALGDAVADAAGRWTISSAQPQPADAGQSVAIRADALDPVTGRPRARAEVRFERLEPGETVISLMPVPQERAQAQNPSYDRLVVRKGDNLWRISRKIYGEGIRYTNIYIANQDQIRDPDLIYPGQVFAVPKGVLQDEG